MASREKKLVYWNLIIAISITLLLILFSLTSVFGAGGNTYYVSTTGSDSNDGLSETTPFKTFSHAIPLLMPGDTLILEDGEYTLSNSGYLLIDCSSNSRNGNIENPITVKSKNERKGFIHSDGSDNAIRIRKCEYWNLIGLRAKSNDLPNEMGGKERDVISVEYSDNVILKRMISTNNNRYFNDHTFSVIDSKNIILEECEAYYFHRHGISIWKSNNIIIRRCYANSRGYSDIPGYGESSYSWNANGGDESFVFYQSSNSIVENSISENMSQGFQAHGGTTFEGLSGGDNNQFLGSISINDVYGGGIDARPYGNKITSENPYGIEPAENNLYKNFLVVNPIYSGLYLRDGSNTSIEITTVIGSLNHHGIVADSRPEYTPCETNPAGCSFTVRNTLVFNNNLSGIYSVKQDDWLVEYSNGYNNSPNYYPSETIDDDLGNITNSLSIYPKMGLNKGECIVYVPNTSPMKGAGKNGEDIGANILYRYENGELTSEPLWDAYTGKFLCGAIVSGINDEAGNSCFDVHKRLNVNYNGCYLPYYNCGETNNGVEICDNIDNDCDGSIDENLNCNVGQTCEQKGGIICASDKTCNGIITSADYINNCCLGNCITEIIIPDKTCAEQNGKICNSTQYCTGAIGSAKDGECCLGECVVGRDITECKAKGNACRETCLINETQSDYFCEEEKICCSFKVNRFRNFIDEFWVFILIGIGFFIKFLIKKYK